MALVCLTVTAPTMAELRRKRDEATTVDLVELRLDSVADPDVSAALADRRRPVIVTCRPRWEGGQFAGSEEERRMLLAEALAKGADYVDVEWRAGFDDLIAEHDGRRIVLSTHDFDGVPDDLGERARAMKATGAQVIKIAAQTQRLSDCLPLIEIGKVYGRDGGVVVIGMGECGVATRVLARQFKSRWTYTGDQQAVGQLTPNVLVDEFRFRAIGDSTEVYGVVGSPIAHSVSPAMHNAAFRASYIDAVYLPFRAADADDFVRFGKAVGIKGASVTIPFKVALFDRVDEVYPIARRIGAINTIKDVGGRWVGGNTDASAFLEPLQNLVPLAGKRVSLVGAGGAARAAAAALASSGAMVTVHARRQAIAERVAMTASASVGPWPPAPNTWDILVNCTPIGMYPHVDETPVDARRLSGHVVYDLVYNPTETKLLREASSAGCQTIGGIEMLVAQAQQQFTWWTGKRPPAGVMREAALQRLSEFIRDENHVI